MALYRCDRGKGDYLGLKIVVFNHTAAIILFGTANPVLLLSREDRVACRVHNWLDGQLHAGPFNIIWVLRTTKMGNYGQVRM